MTAVGDIIQPGQSIPDDVTAMVDNEEDTWHRTPRGHWHLEPIAEVCEVEENCYRGGGSPDSAAYGPLTVTAVREQPAEPEPDVLDLVRQYGGASAEWITCDPDSNAQRRAGAEQDALLARIEAEVQRLKEAAEADATGDLAAQRDDAQRARDFLAEQVVKPARAALDAVGIGGGVKLVDRILTLANERDEARSKASHLALELAAAEQMLKVATAEPDPLVLSLPTVPEGAVALVGETSGKRYTRRAEGWAVEGGAWWRFRDVMFAEGSVTVEMREPRKWPALPGDPEGVKAVRGASGRIYRPDGGYWSWRGVDGSEVNCESFVGLQNYDGPLVEVFDDKDSTR